MAKERNTIAKIFARLIITELDWCHEWSGYISSGYGRVGFKRDYHYVHVIVYEHYFGPIPEGLELDHTCGNKRCANVNHLELVTHKENCLRSDSPWAMNAQKTHCPLGHPYSGSNLMLRPNGGRRCRACCPRWDRRKT